MPAPRRSTIARTIAAPLISLALATLATGAQAEPSSTARTARHPQAPDDSVLASTVPVDIRGTIRDANGTPVRNASVRLMSDSDTLEVVTDRSGRFHGKIPTRRGIAVRVRAPGYRDLVRFVPPATRPIGVLLTLPPPYPMSSVTVVASAAGECGRERAELVGASI